MQARRFGDLFAGCGGLSLGLSMVGMCGVFAVERDEMAFETFAQDFVLEGSPEAYRFEWPEWLEQRAWGIDDILDKYKVMLEQLQGTVDILAGGPPCQGFSFAGRRVEDDPRNRLFEKYVEVVRAVKPPAPILENVPGMRVAHKRASLTDPQGEIKPSRQSFYEKLTNSPDAAD